MTTHVANKLTDGHDTLLPVYPFVFDVVFKNENTVEDPLSNVTYQEIWTFKSAAQTSF
jgi:hypothetical protein